MARSPGDGLKPIPETLRAIESLGLSEPDDDLLGQLTRAAAQVGEIVPACVGFSLAVLDREIDLTFTLVASTADAAALDAVQYLDGGPCVTAVAGEQPLAYDHDALFDEGSWQLFGRATAAHGIQGTLTLPILESGKVVGSVNLYAGEPDAFTGHHESLARIFNAWAPGAVTNADLGFSTRRAAEQTADDVDVARTLDRAARLLATELQTDVEQARRRLADAARRAGISELHVARLLLRIEGRSEDPDETP